MAACQMDASNTRLAVQLRLLAWSGPVSSDQLTAESRCRVECMHAPPTPAVAPPVVADLSELELPPQVELTFPHGTERCDMFEVAMTPGEAGGAIDCAGGRHRASLGGSQLHRRPHQAPRPALPPPRR